MKVFMILVLLLKVRCVCGQNGTDLSPQQSPTMGPTLLPTLMPSLSLSPTVSPPPSAYPSVSLSAYPSLEPSISSSPTISPEPSSHPSSMPSAMPSLNVTIIAKRYYKQTFQAERAFESVELAIFKKFMESYTDGFEYGVTDHIVTNCTVVSQLFNDTTSILSIDYSMNYTTNYMIFERISNYPEQFYALQNMTILTEQLAQKGFSPQLVAIELVMLDEGQVITLAPIDQPTLSPVTSPPTYSPSRMITGSPTKDYGASLSAGDGESVDNENADENKDPDNAPSNTDLSSNSEASDISEAAQQNTDFSVTFAPSPLPPMNGLPTTTEQPNSAGKSGLGVGLGVGIFVAAVICVGLMFTWMRFQKKEHTSTAEATSAVTAIDEEAQEAPPVKSSLLIMNPAGIESPKSFSDEESYRPLHTIDIEAAQTDSIQADSYTTGATPEQGNIVIPMLITHLDDSDTSSDILGDFSLNEDADIFDNYKNNQLEELRDGVTSFVGDSEGMMSLAMTQALVGESDGTAEDILDGAGNPNEIEANFLFETNDWLKKNQESPVDTHEFFQEILNKMVVIVRIGIIHPLDAARIIYCCAAILGLKLLKDFPNDMLLVLGMRKTNDASQGRTYLVDAFKEFGAIDGAAIALDKGFGFVRFVHSSSVDLALERFRTAEIEVQGVSVMIKSVMSMCG
mmetsp:Transcript_19106/g.32171  ORF Transcript_19106/g.32171 Transcript_19106/m.32171 type:complete len:682 (-) Transcript_19106:117-2162(-)